MNSGINKPIIQIVGYKNSGKTTVTSKLVTRFKENGLRVGTIKHDAHNSFSLDQPGTDTWKHSEAGADRIAISSAERSAMLWAAPASLDALLEQMNGMDIVLIEGYKQANYPKLLLIRDPLDVSLLHELTSVIAVMAWPEAEIAVRQQIEKLHEQSSASIPCFNIDELERIYAYINQRSL